MKLTILQVASDYGQKPRKKWYRATLVKVMLQTDQLATIPGWRRLYSYSVANASTLFIRYDGKLWCLESSFGPVPGDTFREWEVRG